MPNTPLSKCPAIPLPLLKWLEEFIVEPEIEWDQTLDHERSLIFAHESGAKELVEMLWSIYNKQQQEINPGGRRPVRRLGGAEDTGN